MHNPTDEQCSQATIVQHDLLETINRLIIEGVDRRVIMAGVAAATADLITSSFGADFVAPWFDRQALLTREMQQGC